MLTNDPVVAKAIKGEELNSKTVDNSTLGVDIRVEEIQTGSTTNSTTLSFPSYAAAVRWRNENRNYLQQCLSFGVCRMGPVALENDMVWGEMREYLE